MSLRGKVGRRPPLAPDPEVIRALAGLLAETGLTEIEYAIGDHRLRVARGAPAAAVAPPPPGIAEAERAHHPHSGNGHANGHAEEAAHPGTVKSPMVGIAYLAPQPGMPPFVRAGDVVSEGQTLLIIEAMKVMNQIRAPHSGRITRIFVGDAEPVEYAAALMLIE